jgi:hypothetical protein
MSTAQQSSPKRKFLPGRTQKETHCPHYIINEFGTMNLVLKSEFSRMNLRLQPFAIATLLLILACGRPALAQTAPDAHASHHPAAGAAPMPAAADQAAQAAPGAAPVTPGGNQAAPPGAGGMSGSPPAAAAGEGMEAGMGEMMKQMGLPPRKELYPSLMALPDEVTPEERATIEQLAQERMKAGTALMSSGLEKLSDSTSDQDYAAMQQAAAQMREGLAQFEAGIAARRVLAEGKLPRNLALEWFKREMNLASPIGSQEPRTVLGVPVFHLFTMVLLVAFALAMVAMYFFKMRRAAALFGRLGPDNANPPPGSSPPLAGAAGPSVPVPGGGAENAG